MADENRTKSFKRLSGYQFRVPNISQKDIQQANQDFIDNSILSKIDDATNGKLHYINNFSNFSKHDRAVEDIAKDIKDYYPMARKDRTPQDIAINYAGGYDWGSRIKPEELNDAIEAAKAYQMKDNITAPFTVLWNNGLNNYFDNVKARQIDSARDYLENVAGLKAAMADRESGALKDRDQLIRNSVIFGEQQGYAEGGLVGIDRDSIREYLAKQHYNSQTPIMLGEDLPIAPIDQLRLQGYANKRRFNNMGEDMLSTMAGLSGKSGKHNADVFYNNSDILGKGRERSMQMLGAKYGYDFGPFDVEASVKKPLNVDQTYIGDLIANAPVGDGSAYAGIEGIKSPYMNDLAGYIAGYHGKVGDGHLSASLFEPKDHENSGRQAMINYSMPFAEGGKVSTDDTALDDYAQLLSDYPEAQAFLHKFNEQNFEPRDSIIASTLAHPIETAKRFGNKFTENVNTLMGYPDLESAEPLYQRPDSEKVRSALDLAGLAQTGALPFAPRGAGVLGTIKNMDKPIKASEALGQIEGRPLVITQADRTKVGGGYLGGPGFSSLQLTNPLYEAAKAAWGVKTPGVARTILGGLKSGENPVYTTYIGTPTQHHSNQMVFDTLFNKFKKASQDEEAMTPELLEKINNRLANYYKDKSTNENLFPEDVNILGRNFKKNYANTFDRRAAIAEVMGGVGVGGKKGQIIDYDKIIRNTTDPHLLEAPTGSLGNRLFTLSGDILENRHDLHPAFPTILQGEDLGVKFEPVPRELVMRDFIDQVRKEKGREPGYFDWTLGYPPSQLITEDLLTDLQKKGYAKGGQVSQLETLYNKYDTGE